MKVVSVIFAPRYSKKNRNEQSEYESWAGEVAPWTKSFHTTVRIWIQVPRTHRKLAWYYTPPVPVCLWWGWERGMSQKLGPASLASMVTKTLMLYQTKWEVELTPRVVLWLPHMSYGMYMPVLIHMNTQARAHAHVCTHTGYTCMHTDTPTCRHLCSHADTKIKKRFFKKYWSSPLWSQPIFFPTISSPTENI